MYIDTSIWRSIDRDMRLGETWVLEIDRDMDNVDRYIDETGRVEIAIYIYGLASNSRLLKICRSLLQKSPIKETIFCQRHL